MGNVGTIKATINSAIAMKERGYEVKLYKPYREWEGYEDVLEKNGIEVIDFGLQKKIPKLPQKKIGFRFSMVLISLFSYSKLKRNWEKEHPDVVMAYLLGYFPLLVRRHSQYKPKIINSIQGKPKFNRFRKWLWRRLYGQSDWLITLSEHTRKDIIENISYPKNRISMVPNPIIDNNIDVVATEKLPKEREGTTEPVILGVGRLTRQKDFETLIRAYEIVQKKVDCRLWILGEGEQYTQLKTLIDELKLGTKAELLGFVKNPYQYMRKADVFVLSSLWEDAGHVLVEAAYMKVKLVSTRCPYGQEEFLDFGKRGELCDMKSPEDMARAILFMLDKENEEENKKRSQLAYQAALQFSMEGHGNNLSLIVNNVMKMGE